MRPCRICGNREGNTPYIVREMMFGFGDEFEYFQCGKCECLQISEIPADLSKYYPREYYAFAHEKPRWPVTYLKMKRAMYSLTGKGLLGRVLVAKYGTPQLMEWVKEWRDQAKVSRNDAILDVGSGRGIHLIDLWHVGFRNLTGIDPFLESDIDYGHGIRVLKKYLRELEGSYDFVMMHHSFEHMPDPEETLLQVRRILAPGRHALIRMPVIPSYAWRQYGVHWVQLDAPRHLFVHSRRSMEILAQKSGLQVTGVLYDSDARQFWGSEQYQRGIPFMSGRSYYVRPKRSEFSDDEIKSYEAKAHDLNARGEGDSACFYLWRDSSL